MKIEVYESIRVEIEEGYDRDTHEEANVAIVYVGGIEIYRQTAGYIPEEDYGDREVYLANARDSALIPLAVFLKKALA